MCVLYVNCVCVLYVNCVCVLYINCVCVLYVNCVFVFCTLMSLCFVHQLMTCTMHLHLIVARKVEAGTKNAPLSRCNALGEIFSESSGSNKNQIVFNIFRTIRNRTEFRLVLNQSKNGNYNLIWCGSTRLGKTLSEWCIR